ncbi:MAG TPA: AfsR/SARP family transcriptional regulator, partial [Gemmatimonadales bacterium]|nr:AfsR/SARP family transcriptional regulator [Gemmatimonadales bacterium]
MAVHGERARVVLATLALSAGQAIAVSAIAQRVWNSQQPASVHASLANHVTRLRRMLGGSAIRTTDSGYLLDVGADQVDVLRFRRLTAQAAGERDARAARALLAAALDLWRGEALETVDSEVLQRDIVPALVEERLLALEQRIELDLAASAHADLLGELLVLTARYPLREPLWRQLITALDGSGRHADALDAYARLRAGLRDELGVEPTAELQELFRRLLGGLALSGDEREAAAHDGRDGAGDGRAAGAGVEWGGARNGRAGEVGDGRVAGGGAGARGDGRVVEQSAGEEERAPQELPGDVADFSGRVSELRDLVAAASASSTSSASGVGSL